MYCSILLIHVVLSLQIMVQKAQRIFCTHLKSQEPKVECKQTKLFGESFESNL